MDMVRRPFREIGVDDGMCQLVGDHPHPRIRRRDVDRIFRKGIVGDLLLPQAIFLGEHRRTLLGGWQDHYLDVKVFGVHIEHELRLFDNGIDFGRQFIFNRHVVLLLDQSVESWAKFELVVEFIEDLLAVTLQRHMFSGVIGVQLRRQDHAGKQPQAGQDYGVFLHRITCERTGGVCGHRRGDVVPAGDPTQGRLARVAASVHAFSISGRCVVSGTTWIYRATPCISTSITDRASSRELSMSRPRDRPKALSL